MLKYDKTMTRIFEYNKIFGYILNNNRYNNYIWCTHQNNFLFH